MRRPLVKKFIAWIAPWLGFAVYKCLYFTWRIRVHESEDLQRILASNTPIVFAHWHGDELGIIHLLKRYRVCAMVSTSSDGQLMDRVVRLFGARTSRGSSTRGGVSALRGILRLAKDGWRPSVAVDGPKGPYHKVKPGVFEIAKIVGVKIIPTGVSCTKAWVFEKAWNKTYLPRPFARLEIVFGPAVCEVTRDADPHDSALASRLEIALFAAEQQARLGLAET